MLLRNVPIRRKLMTIILLTVCASLLLTSVAYSVVEYALFRQNSRQHLTTLGQVIAANSTAALAFDDESAMNEILSALRAEPHVVAAGLYDKSGKLVAHYITNAPPDILPAAPGQLGFRFERSYQSGCLPVYQGDKLLGTLCLKSDMGAMWERLRANVPIAASVTAASLLLAYLLSRLMQQQISRPILALANAARDVSSRKDYSVRVTKYGGDEVGFLTDSFNQMLAQIQTQHAALLEGEARTRAVINSAISAVIVIDARGNVIDWNTRAEQMFGHVRAEVAGKSLAETIIPPRYREAHQRGLERFLATGEGRVMDRVVEMSALRRNGEEFPVELSISPLKTGNVTTFCGFITDITERRRMQEAHTRLATIVQSTDEAIISKSLQGIITSWNPAAQKLFGYSESEAVGQPMLMLFPAGKKDEERQLLERLAHGETVQPFETVRVKKDGAPLDVLVTLSPMLNAEGQVSGVSTIVHDITERKRAEAALRGSEERFRALVTASSDVIYRMNPDWTEMWHLRGRDFIADTNAPSGNWLPKYIHPKDQPLVLATINEAIRTRGIFALEHQVLRVDGSLGWTFSRAVPVLGDDGEIREWFGAASDITARKETERKLQVQLERLALLSRTTRAIGERQDLHSIFQVVVRSLEDNLPVDFGCVCLYDGVKETLSVVNLGLKGRPLAAEMELNEKAVLPIDENGLARCIRGELVYEPDITGSQFLFPQRLAKGGLAALVIAPLLVESQVFGVLVAARRQANSFSSADCEFLRQLSEHAALAAHQAQLYDALQRAYNDLRQSQQAVMQQERLRALGQMASGIAHDINNAISPVSLYTESLLEREPNLSPRAREYLETISRAIDDVAATVARMREFYRQREPQLSLAPVNLNKLVKEVLDLTRARWSDMPQQRGAVIEAALELAADLPPVMGVESEIREALTNLVFNAVDAMPEGGKLVLRTGVSSASVKADQPSAPQHAHVAVSDTGVGMDEETRRRCLEPFFTTKGERGTGLGLAMVYGVMQRHSGDIEIESAPGRGTTVRLIFAVPTQVIPGAPVADIAPAVPARMRILVVDDDPTLLKSLRDTLEADGHVVVTMNSGQLGIETFRAACEGSERFGVVITDLGMPHMDGRMVAQAIKAASPETPVIMLTGWGRRLQADGEIPPHVDQILNKPPKLHELRQALARFARLPGVEKSPNP